MYRKMPRNQCGLIEAPTPQAPAMEWHRHKHIRVCGKQSCHCPSHLAGEPDAPAMFQPQRDMPRNIVVHYGGARAVVVGRMLKARRAADDAGWQGYSAGVAP